VSRKAIAILVVVLLLPAAQCVSAPEPATRQTNLENERKQMIEEQIRARGIRNQRVLDAMSAVPRHEFVHDAYRTRAYDDSPLPTSSGQTISQPYIVALMTELADPKPQHRALEIGTGSGYQAAILSLLVRDVYTVEIVSELARTADERLARLNFKNVHVREGNGYLGWAEHAPYDIIIVTAGATEIPGSLVEQLKPGGRMIIPVGSSSIAQDLQVVEKDSNGKVGIRDVIPVRFVPLRRQ
jgi:protein-L-isoaspartate(D-aspartate) O-methyltransferase